MLAKVDVKVGHAAGMRFVVAQRTGAEGPADPRDHVGSHVRDEGSYSLRPQRCGTERIGWCGVDGCGCFVQHRQACSESDIDRAEVSERCRPDVPLLRRIGQSPRHPHCAAVPAGGNAMPPYQKPGGSTY